MLRTRFHKAPKSPNPPAPIVRPTDTSVATFDGGVAFPCCVDVTCTFAQKIFMAHVGNQILKAPRAHKSRGCVNVVLVITYP